MKINREQDGHLEIVNANILLPGGLILLGGGLFVQESLKFIHGQLQFVDIKSDLPIMISALFLLLGLVLICRYGARFDGLQQRMTWKRVGFFGTKIRVVPFADIKYAVLECDPNQFVNDHPQRGSMARLVVSTAEGSLPLAGMYTYRNPGMEKARDTINEYLGRSAEEPTPALGTELQTLVDQGRLIHAIKLVREQKNCSLAEAKQIVDDLARARRP